MDPFLEQTEIVDWAQEEVLGLANRLSRALADPVTIAGRCFRWVRDEIAHSGDHDRGPVTWIASDVLTYQTGFCYAKSHLLAALLRALGIPAGFCYQRLSIDGDGPPFCLHGLNAALLPGFGWYRLDARGDRPGLATDFDPPRERLAFAPRLDGEGTFDAIWPEPLPVVIDALRRHDSPGRLLLDLPDMPWPATAPGPSPSSPAGRPATA